ncbi:MAG: cation transporter [Victivallales bacterium]|nr:cation transporter [Victivallales bacterium]
MELHFHEHEHDHSHAHKHHHTFNPTTGKRFILAIAVNLIYVAAEYYLGYRWDSVGLIADASHNLGDVGSLVISLTAFLLTKKHADSTFTYGFRKATVLAAFINSMILLGAVALIVYECIMKFMHGSAASGGAIMATAGIGIIVNGLTTTLLSAEKEDDLNLKGAYLHMLADTLVSVGVVVSGGLIMLTHQTWLDPVVGLAIACVILFSSWSLFKESLVLTLDGVPRGIDLCHLQEEMLEVENVQDVHHLHVWALSTTENSLTAHIKLHELSGFEKTREALKALLRHHDIAHCTLEFESAGYTCREQCS